MPYVLAVLVGVLGLFFLVRWLATAEPAQIVVRARQVIRLLVLLLASRIPFFGYLVPIFWGFAKKRAAAASSNTMAEAQARDLLGVAPTASKEEINRAWRSLMATAHPDVGGSQELAARLNQARDILLKK